MAKETKTKTKAKPKNKQTPNVDLANVVKNLQKTDGHESARLVRDIGQCPFFLSTGDDILDIYISNRKHGGVAGGRITQLSGLQQSGKSLVCAHLIKSCQDINGIPILIDTQAATSWQFMQAIGVDIDRVIYYDNLNTIQKIHKITQELMYSVKLNMPETPVLIIVDSLTAASTEKEIQNTDYENKGYLAAIKAKMNSEALRKLAPMAARQKVAIVYTSQLRVKMDVMNPYMDKYESSSGGKALGFYASTRVRLAKKSKLKQKVYGVQTVVGVRTKARIDKSRLGPANRQCEFDVYYDAGIDNYSNWLETLKKYKIIEGKGTKNLPWVIKYQGQEIPIDGKFNETIRKDQELREQVYDVIADILILKYKNIEDVEGRQIIIQDQE